jgi:murein DD-endopeptidase MepM/ murein hydrolase activator NlpD
MAAVACIVCKNIIGDGESFVLLRRGREEAHCSQVCLVARIERGRRARAAARWRWLLRATAVALLVAGAPRLWHRVRLPQPQAISFDLPEVKLAAPPRPQPPMFGPAWPPTDDDWLFAFAHTAWTYPLPGPARRVPAIDGRILAGRAPAVCRVPGRCGVDVGGELWGEHVYAAHDGVVDRVQRAAGDARGDVYLRLAHFGGMVFTHYVHLAAVPRGIAPGAIVKAGDLVGLVGDTGNERTGPYVHFALSVRPASAFPEVYWDPTELMAHWPLRLPPHGTVAGFVPPEPDLMPPPFFRRRSK